MRRSRWGDHMMFVEGGRVENTVVRGEWLLWVETRTLGLRVDIGLGIGGSDRGGEFKKGLLTVTS